MSSSLPNILLRKLLGYSHDFLDMKPVGRSDLDRLTLRKAGISFLQTLVFPTSTRVTRDHQHHVRLERGVRAREEEAHLRGAGGGTVGPRPGHFDERPVATCFPPRNILQISKGQQVHVLT